MFFKVRLIVLNKILMVVIKMKFLENIIYYFFKIIKRVLKCFIKFMFGSINL
jgi:hypothetical protein